MALFDQRETIQDFLSNKEKIDKIVFSKKNEGEELLLVCPARTYPSEWLCWIPKLGSLFLLFGTKNYLLVITDKRLMVLRVSNNFGVKRSFFYENSEIQSCEITKRKDVNSYLKMIIKDKETYTFKELYNTWADDVIKTLDK